VQVVVVVVLLLLLLLVLLGRTLGWRFLMPVRTFCGGCGLKTMGLVCRIRQHMPTI
jgi:hypothetical protein